DFLVAASGAIVGALAGVEEGALAVAVVEPDTKRQFLLISTQEHL
ncbi:hypothetical protein A2U01_0091358, partial [Trifolium medium]|nr:hypothetical protein [Trifolium medium]